MSSSGITWQKTICGICPAACWVEAGMKNGKLVGLRADKDHPLGMICEKGKHAPEIVYSKHRLRYPLKRKGKKGTYDFQRISWEEAYETIAANLYFIKDREGPEAVSIYTGRGAFELSLCDMFKPADTKVSSASNILFPFGSPNTMGVGALCYVSFAMIAPHVTMGRMLVNMFHDIENAGMVVVWGANPATDSPSLDMKRLESAARRGSDIVAIDPRKTETVYRTNARWIPVRPGTDGALALGLIRLLIEEEWYDKDFAHNWCRGFEALKTYVQHFPPGVVEKITGIPEEVQHDLAYKIAHSPGACPVMYTGLEYSNSGIQAIRAVFTLFALAGHLDAPGGIGLARPAEQFRVNTSCNRPNPDLDKAVARDKFPLYSKYRGESHASGLIDSVLHGDPYPVKGLLIHGASLLTSWPQPSLWRKVLSNLDFQVCIDRQLTADAAYADIVLPATTMFEINSYAIYGNIFRLRERLIDPVGEARNDYLIMSGLAEALGYGHLYPRTEEDMIRFALNGSGYSLEDIRKAGGWIQLERPPASYKKWQTGELREDGKQGFDTPGGKFEIFSQVLEEYGYEPLPKYTESTEGPLAQPQKVKTYPLVFNSGSRSHYAFRSQHHGVKGLNRKYPEPLADIHPEDARQRGIKNGDLVRVRTSRGAVPFRCRVTPDIARGSVDCSMGGGTPAGPEAWQKWNVNELTDMENYDEISGFPVYKALLCEVEKIKSRENGTPLPVVHSHAEGSTLSGKRPSLIYLDNNATTPLADPVKNVMKPFLETAFGNPSSIHRKGIDARKAIESSRRKVARLLNAKPGNVIFTGGGSEANNLALKGVAFKHKMGAHIVTSTIEHPSVLNACNFLENAGYRVTRLPVDEHGMVSPQELEKALEKDTVMVSIMLANNETGTLQPVSELARIARSRGVLFHTDAVQGAGKVPLDVDALGIDLLTISGHKLHGPKGVGALYVCDGVELIPLVHGGKQENSLRGGTENVGAIAGFGKAASLALKESGNNRSVEALRERLEKGIFRLVPEARLNGHPQKRLPNTTNLSLPGLRGESVVVGLDHHGIALSSGSACKAGSSGPTHVLLAMGSTEEEAHCAVRFSLSKYTSRKEIDRTLDAFEKLLEERKTTVRFLSCK